MIKNNNVNKGKTPVSGRNTTAVTNPKTKSNTTANTTSAGGKIMANANTKSAQKTPVKSQGTVKNAMTKNGNCKWEVSMENCQLTDLDIISDVLSTQKGIIGKYGKAICEVDCVNLRSLINAQMSECAADQFDSFLYMNQRGMYPTENAPAPKINQMKKKFTDYAMGIKK